MAPLKAGAGRAQIAYPDSIWPLDGFVGCHDPLYARVLVLDAGETTVWAVIDQTSLAPKPLDAIRQGLALACGACPQNVIVSVSHTFAAPHLGDEPGGESAQLAVIEASLAAAKQALENLQPACLRAGSGQMDINHNRDVASAAGWTLGEGTGISDKTLQVLVFESTQGAQIAWLVNYAVQPSVRHQAPDHLASSDLVGVAMAHIENTAGGVAMFLIGAAGDQAPAFGHHPDWDAVTSLGVSLGQAALDAQLGQASMPVPLLRASTTTLPGQVPTPREQIRATRHPSYTADDAKTLPWWILRLGATAIAGVQVELNAATGLAIRAASPFEHTLVATMVNGGAKYLPDEDSFTRGTYEAQSSFYAKGGAEMLATRLGADLGQLWRTL